MQRRLFPLTPTPPCLNRASSLLCLSPPSPAQHDTCFDFYGKRVATCSSDRSVRIFDVQADGSRVQSGECTGHEGPVWQAAWAHPQFGTLLATCGYDARVMVFREAAPTTGASSNWVRVFVYEKNKSSGKSRSVSCAPPLLLLFTTQHPTLLLRPPSKFYRVGAA